MAEIEIERPDPADQDRIVLGSRDHPGMTQIRRRDRVFQMAGVGPDTTKALIAFAWDRIDADERAANPDRVNFCRAAMSDGECNWEACPQLRDNEPEATGRHCPKDDGCPRCGRAEGECMC